MPDIWLCADLHLGHKKLVTGWDEPEGSSGPRGHFGTIENHDATIVANFNSVVKPSATVYILGDLMMGKAKGFGSLVQLNGHKRLVLGNHDQDSAEFYAQFFEKVCGAKTLDGMVLTHVPVHPHELGVRKSMQVNVHGHLHNEVVLKRDMRRDEECDLLYRCVSLEQINYTPIHIDEVKKGFGDLLK